jgi:signal transduction histidine kinase
MRRLRLSTLLISLNVGLLVLALLGVAVVAVRLLRQLADEQALARVAQAGISARNAVYGMGQDLETNAQLLSERPTLLRLLQADDRSALATFLSQFQQTSQSDAAVVLRDGLIIAQSGLPVNGEAIWAAHASAPEYFFALPETSGDPLLLGAIAPIPALADGAVMVMVELNDRFANSISTEIGLPVSLTPVGAGTGAFSALQIQTLRSGEPHTVWLESPERYVTLLPLQAPAGAAVGVLTVELSAAEVTDSVTQLTQTLLGLTLGVAALAGLASLLLGRRLADPLQRLTSAAARIGYGDLNTPISRAPGVEMGTLALTLDDMRRRLLQLTADLRRQQAESNAILTGIVESVFTVDGERRIAYINPPMAAMLGLAPEAVLGRFCGDVLNPQGANGLRPCLENCPIIHARARAGARATEHLQLVDGQRRTVIITSAPPTLGDEPPGGGVLRQVQVMRDETELEATRRTRDAVLANISHEFRTPLSAQLASIELLLDQLPDLTRAQIVELVQSLQRGTVRLTQLIDNLLESVRLESGRYAIRRQSVALEDVIDQALDMLRPLLAQREQTVAVELPAALPTVTGDAPRLTQVFVNLLANANKFAPTGSVIHIGGQFDVDTLTVWVEDEGPGLPPASGTALFAPFMRSLSDEPEPGGAGLGLWIVKSIVERHGGEVVATRGAGGGARLSLRLPRERESGL